MNISVDASLTSCIQRQLQSVYEQQTLQYLHIVGDYQSCVGSNRELQVRVGQLDKEAAELRDEVASLHTQLASFSDQAAKEFAVKAEAYRQELDKARLELTNVYRDKSKALEQVLELQRSTARLTAAAEEAAETSAHQAEEIAGLKARLGELSAELDRERDARQLAAAEAESRVAAKEAAEAAAAKLSADNQALVGRLMDLKAREASRLEEINALHEEAMAAAKRQAVEAGAAQQLMSMLGGFKPPWGNRGKETGTSSSSTGGAPQGAAAATGSGGGTPLGPLSRGSSRRSSIGGPGEAAAAAAAAGGAGPPGEAQLAYASLKQKMGLPEVLERPLQEKQLPTEPAKMFMPHKGGACSAASSPHGHYLATCGQDRTAQLWDMNLLQHVHTYHGIMGAVNDVAFTSDGRKLLGAGGDKRLLLWHVHSGQVAHTLTGHTNVVTCCACSVTQEAVAVSAGDDRCLKLWDLAKGYCSRSIPCSKMPNALALSLDGSTIFTGHLDGSVCMWDARQGRAGAAPLYEARDAPAAVLGLATTSRDNVVALAAKDNVVRLWDFRSLQVVHTLRLPHLTLGSVGTMGRGRCHVDVSWDHRWVAAGCAEGQVAVWDLAHTSRRSSASGASGAPAAAGGAPVLTLLQHHKEPVIGVAWSHDGNTLASADKAGGLAMWCCLT